MHLGEPTPDAQDEVAAKQQWNVSVIRSSRFFKKGFAGEKSPALGQNAVQKSKKKFSST